MNGRNGTLSNVNVTVKSILSSGSYGDIYYVTYNGNAAALKKPKTQIKDGNDAISKNRLDGFKKEVHFITGHSLKHGNILQYYHCSLETGIIMEHMSKGSLYAVYTNHPQLIPEDYYHILRGTAAGINYLHENNIVHLDIKSPNILVNDSLNDAKICDFGTAHKMPHQAAVIPAKCGSFPWISPEILNHEKASLKSDMWSFGRTMFEVTVGHMPFMDVEPPIIRQKIKDNQIENVPEDCPIDLKLLIEQCANQNPDRRPTASDCMKRLSSMIANCGMFAQHEKPSTLFCANKYAEIEPPQNMCRVSASRSGN